MVNKIALNIEDREWFELMVAERGERFWELCEDHLSMEREPVPERDVSVMTDAEAKVFENTYINFGTYRGTSFGNLSTKYLEWLSETQRATGKRIAKYLLWRGKYEN